MKIVKNIREMEALSEQAKRKGKTVGLVPTMGALHEGHLSLIREARKETNFLVVSIFVNPTQFGPREDFKKYPRSLKKDIDLLYKNKVDAVFYPEAYKVYPHGYKTYVEVEGLSDLLCGKSRPIHFKGVTTIVLKLFNIVKPDLVFLGNKDFQQQVIIKRMVEDLNMNMKIVSLPIIREKDGLAMSSRNIYLSAVQRKEATVLYRALQFAKILVKSGKKNAKKIKQAMIKLISKTPSAKIDYISICDPETLEQISRIDEKTLIALAVYIGKTRLIDNILVFPRR